MCHYVLCEYYLTFVLLCKQHIPSYSTHIWPISTLLCYHPFRALLLPLGGAGFGDLRPFNRVVRAILKERIDEADKEFRVDEVVVSLRK